MLQAPPQVVLPGGMAPGGIEDTLAEGDDTLGDSLTPLSAGSLASEQRRVSGTFLQRPDVTGQDAGLGYVTVQQVAEYASRHSMASSHSPRQSRRTARSHKSGSSRYSQTSELLVRVLETHQESVRTHGETMRAHQEIEAERVRRQLDIEAERIRKQADIEAERVRKQAETEAERVRKQADLEAERVRTQAELEEKRLQAQVEIETQKTRAEEQRRMTEDQKRVAEEQRRMAEEQRQRELKAEQKEREERAAERELAAQRAKDLADQQREAYERDRARLQMIEQRIELEEEKKTAVEAKDRELRREQEGRAAAEIEKQRLLEELHRVQAEKEALAEREARQKSLTAEQQEYQLDQHQRLLRDTERERQQAQKEIDEGRLRAEQERICAEAIALQEKIKTDAALAHERLHAELQIERERVRAEREAAEREHVAERERAEALLRAVLDQQAQQAQRVEPMISPTLLQEVVVLPMAQAVAQVLEQAHSRQAEVFRDVVASAVQPMAQSIHDALATTVAQAQSNSAGSLTLAPQVGVPTPQQATAASVTPTVLPAAAPTASSLTNPAPAPTIFSPLHPVPLPSTSASITTGTRLVSATTIVPAITPLTTGTIQPHVSVGAAAAPPNSSPFAVTTALAPLLALTSAGSAALPPFAHAATHTRRKEKKCGEYSGDTDVDSYIRQFDMIASYNGWSDADKALELSASLRGNARQTVLAAPDAASLTYVELCQRLRESYGPVLQPVFHATALDAVTRRPKETVRQLVDRLRPMGQLAYPRITDMSQREELLTRHFISALTDADQRKFVLRDLPTTLAAAATAAELYETINRAEERRADYVPPQVTAPIAKKVRVIESEADTAVETVATPAPTPAWGAAVDEFALSVRALTEAVTQIQQKQDARPPRGRGKWRGGKRGGRRDDSRSDTRGEVRAVNTNAGPASQDAVNDAEETRKLRRELADARREIDRMRAPSIDNRDGRDDNRSNRDDDRGWPNRGRDYDRDNRDRRGRPPWWRDDRSSSRPRRPTTDGCFNCGSLEHWKRECPYPKRGRDGSRDDGARQENEQGRGDSAGSATGRH